MANGTIVARPTKKESLESLYRASAGLTSREFCYECMSHIDVLFPSGVSLPALQILQSEIHSNDFYIMNVGMTI